MSGRERSRERLALQSRYFRALADRIERGETTDEDDFVIDAIEDAKLEWKSGPTAEHLDELSRRASELGISCADFVRHAVALQLKILRGTSKLAPELEGKMRLAELARWDAETREKNKT